MADDAQIEGGLDTSVFPLPLVPFERYMRADDRPWLPMAFTIRLFFSGNLRPEAFRRALQIAVGREPLLRACLQGTSARDSVWIAASDEPPLCDIGPPELPMHYPDAAQIDLTRHPGLRTWIRHDDRRAEMRFQFHHCCCDGVGAYRFLDDLLCIYDRLVRPSSTVEPSPLDPALLPRRACLGLSPLQAWLRLPLRLCGAFAGGLLFFLRRSETLAVRETPRVDEAAQRRLPDDPVRRLSTATLAALSAQAKARGASLNDLLTTDLFLTLADWQTQTTGRPLDGRLRLMIPVNARTADDRWMPATNIVGMLPISRTPRQLARPQELLGGVSRYLTNLRRLGGVDLFLNGLRMFEVLFGGFSRMLSDDCCRGTACLSNMGRVFSGSKLPRRDGKLSTGDLTLEKVESAPPVRPLTPVSFSILSYAEELTLVLNFDRRAMTDSEADELLQLYARRLEQRAEHAR